MLKGSEMKSTKAALHLECNVMQTMIEAEEISLHLMTLRKKLAVTFLIAS
jgi:hypothetical protein